MDKNKNKAFNMSLKYLGYKMRTEKEVRDYLLRKKFSEEDILDTINKLIEYKYINDYEYTEFYIRDKYNFFNQGRYKIINDLIRKGIPKNIVFEKVENFFDEEKEIEKIKKLYYKKNPSNKELTDKDLHSICNFILRKGFPGRLVSKVVFQLSNESKSHDS